MRFSPGEADLEEYWGVRAVHTSVLGFPHGVVEPPRTSIIVISKGQGVPGFGRN